MEGSWSASLTGRTLRRAGAWWGGAWRVSVSGRVLLWLSAALRTVVTGSVLFSLRGAIPRPLRPDDPDSTVVGRLLALAYWTLRRSLGYGAPGRLSRRFGRGVAGSVMVEGGWVAVVGAAVAGLGVGGLVGGRSDVAGWIALTVAGAIAAVVGVFVVGPPEGGLLRPARRPLPALLLTGFAVGCLAAAVPGLTPQVVAFAVVPLAAVMFAYRPELLLLVLACFPWVDWLARNGVGGSVGAAWDELLIVGSFAALGVAVVLTCRWDLTSIPQAVCVFAVAVAGVGSVVMSGVGPEAGLFALRVTLQPLLFFLLGYLLPRDRRFMSLTIALFLGASLLLALHGLYQYVTQAPMPASWVDARETEIGTRAYSIIENPNGLGAYLLMGTLLGLALALGRLPGRLRLAAAGVTIVLAAGVAVTFSRGSWLGLAVGLLALTALAHRRLLAGLAAVGAAALVFAPRPFVERLTFAFSGEYINKSLSAGRLYIWQVAFYRLAEHPWFGVGLGTFGGSTAFIFGFSRLWIDNFYVQLAAEGGLVLLAALMWLLLRTAKGLVAAHLGVRDPLFRAVTAGGFAAFLAVCTANLTAGVWETVAVGAGSWFLAGLAASTSEAHLAPLPRVRDMAVRPSAVDVLPGSTAADSDTVPGAVGMVGERS